MKTTLIIATYNWPRALDLVLESVKRQTHLPDEVIIADDGSSAETKMVVDKHKENFPTSIIHIWHQDKGFRLAEIRNKAIKTAHYEYIIQIDGDVILHPSFVQDHKKMAQKNCFITGSRTLLLSEITKEILKSGNINIHFFTKNVKNRINLIRISTFNCFSKIENSPIHKMTHRIRGCNMAFWKQDLLDINGYDQEFVGWGREDSDIVIRLIKKGCFRKKIKFVAIQYHLYHKENSKENLEKNHQMLEKAIANRSFQAKNGLKEITNDYQIL